MNKLTRTHLRRLICEEIVTLLDAEETEEIEPVEDAWAGGENLECDIDHSEVSGGEPVTRNQEVLVVVQSEADLHKIMADILSETTH